MMRTTQVFLSILILSVLGQNALAAENLLRLNSGTYDLKSSNWSQMQSVDSNLEQAYIVQFDGRTLVSDKKFLADQGLQTLSYLPDNAFVVMATGAQASHLKSNPRVYAVQPYLPTYKLSPDLAPLSVFNQKTWTTVHVKTFTNQARIALEQQIEQTPSLKALVQVLDSEDTSLAIAAQGQGLYELLKSQHVEHVGPLFDFRPMVMELLGKKGSHEEDGSKPSSVTDYSDIVGDETGTKIMNFDAAYAQGLHGENQIVSYADTGLDTGNMTTLAADFGGAVLGAEGLALFSPAWADPMGHGTHVAGSIASRGTNSHGLIHGGAYTAQLFAEGMWMKWINNLMIPPRVTRVFTEAYNHGARIESNSWGSAVTTGAYDAFAQMVDDYAFQSQEFLIVFAAGNSGTDKNGTGRIDAGSVGTPGIAKNVLTVGASKNTTKTGGLQKQIKDFKTAATEWPAEPISSSTLSDTANGMAMFSSRGPTKDGRTKPEIVAPGTNILSTRSHVPKASALWGAYNDHYAWSGGTSMATPLTAGAAVIARQWLMDKAHFTHPSSALVKAVMIHTAYDMYPGQFGTSNPKTQELLTPRPNSDEGYGRVDLAALVNLHSPNTQLIDERTGVATGENKSYEFDLAQGESLEANLVYTDAPASANAQKALVNDLDMTLVSPDGTEQGPKDRINNNEYLNLTNLPAGHYKLNITGYHVPVGIQGRQPYALVFTTK